MNRHPTWKRIQIVGALSFLIPLVLLLCGILMKTKGFAGLVENYEEGVARFLQYGLFAIGAGIFFFCDGISDFLFKRISKRNNKDNLTFYLSYILLTIWLLNIISITAFLGFLICGNISWLTVFVILNLSIGIKYLPSQKRMKKLIEVRGK